MDDHPGETTFTSGSIRRSKAFGCIFALGLATIILFQMSKDPTSIVVIYMAILGVVAVGLIVCLVRAFRVGIVLTDEGVVTRTTLSTKTFKWDNLTEAMSRDRRRMATGRNFVTLTQQSQQRIQVVPQLRLTSGKVVRLYGLQVTIPTALSPNWLDDAINEINNRIEARHRALGPDATPSPS